HSLYISGIRRDLFRLAVQAATIGTTAVLHRHCLPRLVPGVLRRHTDTTDSVAARRCRRLAVRAAERGHLRRLRYRQRTLYAPDIERPVHRCGDAGRQRRHVDSLRGPGITRTVAAARARSLWLVSGD